jgi:hypothetical protein
MLAGAAAALALAGVLLAARAASPRPVQAVTTALVRPAAPGAPAGCGLLDFACQAGHAIDSWFADLVSAAINPMFALIGQTLLTTPQVGSIGEVRSIWGTSDVIANAAYVLLVLAGGIIVMGHQTVQSSYSVKEIAPRLVTGFIAANLSLVLAGKAISLADGLSAALAGQGLGPAAAGQMLRSLLYRVLSQGPMFFVLLAVFAVALVIVLAVIFAARLMLTVLLIGLAPLCLACHALPQTEPVARWWWRALAAVLAIQAAQALFLVESARIFFTDGWTSLIAPGDAGTALDAIQLICVLYILVRIPFWLGRMVSPGGGRSPVRSFARSAAGALAFAYGGPALARAVPALGRVLPGLRSGRGFRRGARPSVRLRPDRPPCRSSSGSSSRSYTPWIARAVAAPFRRPRPGPARAAGAPAAGARGGTAQARWYQPPLPGMPTRPSRPRQLPLFDVPPSMRQPRPAAPPPAAPGRGGRRGPVQPPLPGMPSRPARPRQLELPFDPPLRRAPRTAPPRRTPPQNGGNR